MKKKSHQLLKELSKETANHLDYVFQLKNLPNDKLNFKISNEKWSALECIDHLRKYSEIYLKEFEKGIDNSTSKSSTYFKSGLFGGYFAKLMLPGDNTIKMKTFPSMNPSNSSHLNSDKVFDSFLQQEKQLQAILKKAENVNLRKVKIPLSVMPLIKFRLGDMLQVVVFHNKRHLLQAERVLGLFKL